ncbi:hypothetical protein AWM70_17905 [Paenibacillus yonginensis]|uniref:DUF2188 domain-containing protein n=1 Tax=Paenibacillus yonginensis TaxID=1462996 RepID=A0A1B1N469_9BACL|nr:DUF2188 domain-containing protein [Paenibacillus yonginensis]ANS76223.1 hypothetical protein AWM70_17905 [Paenibacillus yonginensis]
MADQRQNHNDREDYFEERAGTDNARYHAVPHDEGGWAVKKEGEDRPVFTTNSKSEAADEAKKRAEEAGTMAILHNEHGRIEDQLNYQDK